MPEKIDYALFDFDGVIADTEPLYLKLDAEVLKRFGYEATEDELRGFVGKASEVEAPALLAAHGIEVTGEQYLAAWDPDRAIYGDSDLQPSPGLAELWAHLRERGVKIAVVSTTRVVSLVRALNNFGLLSYVDAIVGKEMVKNAKPDPEPYLTGLGLLARGVAVEEAASRAVAFDDSPSGVASARAAGIYTVCYQGASVKQQVQQADAFIDTFVGLCTKSV